MSDASRGFARLISGPTGSSVPFERRPALVCPKLQDGSVVPSNIRDCVGPDCGVQVFVVAGRTTDRVDNRELRPLCLGCHIRSGGKLLMLHPEELSELEAMGAVGHAVSTLATMNAAIAAARR
jgi:hypothetical protein